MHGYSELKKFNPVAKEAPQKSKARLVSYSHHKYWYEGM